MDIQKARENFKEFFNSKTGKDIQTNADTVYVNNLTLVQKLEHAEDMLLDLSEQALKPTYDPVVDGIKRVTGLLYQAMYDDGIAYRWPNIDEGQDHIYMPGPSTDTQDILNALMAERVYHSTMFDSGRETYLGKSPSEYAWTMLGLVKSALEAHAAGDNDKVLKLLKDATATGFRGLQEAEEKASIANSAKKHHQKKTR